MAFFIFDVSIIFFMVFIDNFIEYIIFEYYKIGIILIIYTTIKKQKLLPLFV